MMLESAESEDSMVISR